jgi:hypothetical protein
MKKLYPTLAVLSLFLLCTGMILAQGEKPPAAQGQEKVYMFEGELTKVDATDKTISVKSSKGKEVAFRYTDETQVSGAEGGIEGLATKSGTHVRVHFDAATKTASQIEVMQRTQ